MNPATGQVSWLSVDEAACAIQRMVRNHLAAEIGRPTMKQMIKVTEHCPQHSV